MSDKMLEQFFVMIGKHILHQTQHVDWRVGKILKPMLAPTCCNKLSFNLPVLMIGQLIDQAVR